jgi:uncharacterized protein (TIGR02118 family)
VPTKRVVNMVATQCLPEHEQEFNKWYDEVHIPLLFKFKGMTNVNRYKMSNGPGDFPKYLAIYEFEDQKAFDAFGNSPEMAAARAEMDQTWKGRAFEIKWRVQFEPLQTWKK